MFVCFFVLSLIETISDLSADTEFVRLRFGNQGRRRMMIPGIRLSSWLLAALSVSALFDSYHAQLIKLAKPACAAPCPSSAVDQPRANRATVSQCSTDRGVGRCVKNAYCCRSIGGIVATTLPESNQNTSTTSSSNSNSYGISTNTAGTTTTAASTTTTAAGSYVNINIQNPSYRTAKEDDTLAKRFERPRRDMPERDEFFAENSCPYEEVCCVLMELPNPDKCRWCGELGNGDREMLTTTPAPETTTGAFAADTTTMMMRNFKLEPRSLPEKREARMNDGREARVVGGTPAVKNELCWMVALMDKEGVFGAGVLIDPQHVVTAAHKVAGRHFDEIILVLGEYNLTDHNDRKRLWYTGPLAVKLHPDYDPSTYENNLAVIRIPSAPCQVKAICTLCLPDTTVIFPTTTTTTTTTTERPLDMGALMSMMQMGGGKNSAAYNTANVYGYPQVAMFPWDVVKQDIERRKAEQNRQESPLNTIELNPWKGRICQVAGWGATATMEIAQVLQKATVQIISNYDCRDRFASSGVKNVEIGKTSFCAASTQDNVGTCDRDGGGPLYCQRFDGTWELVGLIALGVEDCRRGPQSPTIFTNIGLYVDWLRANSAAGSVQPKPASNRGGSSSYGQQQSSVNSYEQYGQPQQQQQQPVYQSQPQQQQQQQQQPSY